MRKYQILFMFWIVMVTAMTQSARADVRVFFTNMFVNDCKEIGTCDWKLACSLGNQQETEFFSMTEANTNEFISINRVLTQKEFPPVTVTCSVWEHDGGIGAEWETVGTASVIARTTGNHRMRMSNNEGDVVVNMVVEQIGSSGQPLVVKRDQWIQTPASGIADVAVSREGTIWVTGLNGSIWFSKDGQNFVQTPASGFSRISAATDNAVYAVGLNETLWKFDGQTFTQTAASGMGDVAVSRTGRVYAAGKNGTIWFSDDQGSTWTQTAASGFSSIAAGADGMVYAVGTNETLWRFDGNRFTQTPASGMTDVAVGSNGQIYLAGTNGTIWFSMDRGANFTQTSANGFSRVAIGPDNTVYAVGKNGTLWKQSGN